MLVILGFLLFKTRMVLGQNTFHLQPHIGVRFRDDKLPSFNTTDKKVPISLLKVGIRFSSNRCPIFVEASTALFLEPTFDYSFNTSIIGKRVIQNYDIALIRRKSIYGIGFVDSKVENPAVILFGGFRHYRGAGLFYRRNSGPLSVEIRSELIFKPAFSGLAPTNGNFAFDCLYNFGGKKSEDGRESVATRSFWLSATIGSRFFRNKSNSIVLSGEETPKIGISPAFGIDVLFRKWPIGLSVEKDFWVSINGGHPVRNFKGFIANTGFGLKWHHFLKNGRHLRIGVSYLITRDIELQEVMPIQPTKIYQIHGIGTSVSYEIFPRTELEFRNNFPFDGRKPFEARLMTLGLFYRLKT